jgi:dUTP pyrophosphatase
VTLQAAAITPTKLRVTMVRYERGKEPDSDNLESALKAVRDELAVQLGLPIVSTAPSGVQTADDSDPRVEWVCKAAKLSSGYRPHVEVSFEEVRIQVQGETVVRCVGLAPTYATPGSAGFDLKASESCELNEHTSTRIRTGLRVEIPPGHEIQIRPRSGLSARGVHVAVGTIDSDYRGEISVVAWCMPGADLGARTIRVGDRIAQGVLSKVERAAFELASELTSTSRGEGGFGSTGR